ncbi:unnamed protein product [Prunus armeniaca]|uniref:Cathepsin propeptide inhibitor domain-containing protein n=1 Tax=Prunus armeniaca TaxID=36596 RepID=A0A6J5TVY6_PRUAR|nr:unnamed protein product [Prunus armeniaca]CAB4297126.1 unnamed protein product [Prunus armeniaca]
MGSHKIELAFAFFIWASLACFSSCNSLPSEYSIVEQNEVLNNFPTEEKVVELFRLWKQKHGKVYRHAEESERMFENFKRNLKFELEKTAKKRAANNAHDSQRVGLNRFADMDMVIVKTPIYPSQQEHVSFTRSNSTDSVTV